MSGYSDDEYAALIASLIEAARTNYAAFVSLVHRPNYKHSTFSYRVCKAIDQFVDDVLAGKRPILVLEAPPQHGKSSLVSRCLPPYLYGRLTGALPAVRVASASYAQTLANSFARDVKSTMLEPIYREIFPQVSMIGFRGAVDRSDEFTVPQGGAYKAVGAGGPLTGFPVDCFVGATLIDTDAGAIRVDKLHAHAKTVKVLSRNQKGGLEYARIKAIGHRETTRLYRITTEAGRVLEVTGNHPIYAGGRYTAAAELTPGDVLLCAVQDDRDAHRGGLHQTVGAEQHFVLQQDVRGAVEACGEPPLSGLRDENQVARGGALLGVPGRVLETANAGPRGSARDGVRDVRQDVHERLEGGRVAHLQPGLQRSGTFGAHARRGEPEIHRRAYKGAGPQAAAQPGSIPVRAAGDTGPRRAQVRDLRLAEELARPPHRREPGAQLILQFTDTVLGLPSVVPQPAHGRSYESDTVRMVEVLDRAAVVYDLQVETNANLFANGILAHNCAIIDDPTKNAEEALSPVVQDSREAWLDSVVLTRLQLRSGLIIMGTPWSARDLMARARMKFENEAGRYTFLAFPALNEPEQIGYNPDLPAGPLVPHLHDRTKLLELKRNMSEFWWSALYQQQPMSEVGAIFSKDHVQYYRRAELPKSFARIIMSVDATFKDGNGTDYVFAGVWGKVIEEGAERVYLLDWRRERLSFTKTSEAIIALKNKWPRVNKIYIEEAANGAALIDMLSKHFPQIVGVPPLGSKEARAHATSWVWDNKQVFLPHPEESPGIVPVVAEITSFPDTVTGHDDSVDGMSIALHELMLRNPIASMITKEILKQAQAQTRR